MSIEEASNAFPGLIALDTVVMSDDITPAQYVDMFLENALVLGEKATLTLRFWSARLMEVSEDDIYTFDFGLVDILVVFDEPVNEDAMLDMLVEYFSIDRQHDDSGRTVRLLSIKRISNLDSAETAALSHFISHWPLTRKSDQEQIVFDYSAMLEHSYLEYGYQLGNNFIFDNRDRLIVGVFNSVENSLVLNGQNAAILHAALLVYT